jgi:GNAT superfamily N-acetyltransferase
MSPRSYTFRRARPDESVTVSAILGEAATWLRDRDLAMWREEEVSVQAVRPDVAAGAFFLARCAGEPVGTLKCLGADPLFWPEAGAGEALYVHRLAVRRAHAGRRLSETMLRWAVARARRAGQPFLRLDCAADRPALRAVYEHLGFELHSEREVGPYRVARYQYRIATPARGAT